MSDRFSNRRRTHRFRPSGGLNPNAKPDRAALQARAAALGGRGHADGAPGEAEGAADDGASARGIAGPRVDRHARQCTRHATAQRQAMHGRGVIQAAQAIAQRAQIARDGPPGDGDIPAEGRPVRGRGGGLGHGREPGVSACRVLRGSSILRLFSCRAGQRYWRHRPLRRP